MKSDPKYSEFQVLLDLDGLVFWPNPQYWVRFSVKSVEQTTQIPHGIKYSLTMHDRNNTRIVGFDNAHSVKTKKRKKYAGRIIKWDHFHKLERITPYEFESPVQLLCDFWEAVDEFISEKD